jgi:hypothetical protein
VSGDTPPLSCRAVLLRLLNNLKQIYITLNMAEDALTIVRCVLGETCCCFGAAVCPFLLGFVLHKPSLKLEWRLTEWLINPVVSDGITVQNIHPVLPEWCSAVAAKTGGFPGVVCQAD